MYPCVNEVTKFETSFFTVCKTLENSPKDLFYPSIKYEQQKKYYIILMKVVNVHKFQRKVPDPQQGLDNCSLFLLL